MTREEAIEYNKNLRMYMKIEDTKSEYKFLDENYIALDMGIKALEHEQRWIPVSERLPEQPYGCLVTIEDEEPMTGQMFEIILPYFVGWDGEWWNDSEGEQCPFEVIAWMPLPNVYRNEE